MYNKNGNNGFMYFMFVMLAIYSGIQDFNTYPVLFFIEALITFCAAIMIAADLIIRAVNSKKGK